MSGPIGAGLALLVMGAGVAVKGLMRKREDEALQRFFEKGISLSYPVMRTSTALDVESAIDVPSKKKKETKDVGIEKKSSGVWNIGAHAANLTYQLFFPAVIGVVSISLLDYADRISKNRKLRKKNQELSNEIDKNLRIAWELVRYKKKVERGELDAVDSEES